MAPDSTEMRRQTPGRHLGEIRAKMSKRWPIKIAKISNLVEKIQNQNGVSLLLRSKNATKIALVWLDINYIELLLHM